MHDSASAPPASRTHEAVAAWRRQLETVGGADPLTRFEDHPDAILDLASAHPSGLAMFLAGRPTRLSSLFREPGALSDARRRARAIRLAASALEDEHGVHAGHLAVGMLTWDHRRPVTAPVLLRPITLRPRGAGHADYDLDLDGPVAANPALVRLLRQTGVTLDPRELEALAVRGEGFDPAPAFARLRRDAGHLPGFTLRPRLVVSTFADLAPALVAELDRVASDVAGHDVVAALAGDAEARNRLAAAPRNASRPVPDLADVQVLSLDADQRAVLSAVVEGRSVRVEAPPGTGATQTLAAVIAAAAATGRRILLVAARRSEIRDVEARLRRVGLEGLLGGGRSPLRAEDASGAGPGEGPGRGEAAGADEAADRLVREHRALHAARQPWGVSALAAVHELARLTSSAPAPRTSVRLAPEVLRRLDASGRERAAEALREAAALGEFAPGAAQAPWYRARLPGPDDARGALATAARLWRDLLPALRAQMARLDTEAGLSPATSVAECGAQIDLLVGVRDTLDVFTPAVYERALGHMVTATATSAWRSERGLSMGLWERRRWERDARDLLRPGCSVPNLHSALVAAQSQRELWQKMSTGGGWPRVPSGLAAADAALALVVTELRRLEEILVDTPDGGRLVEAPLSDVERRLVRLAGDPGAAETLPRRTAALAILRDMGLEELVDDLRARACQPDLVPAELELAWWRSLLQHLLTEDRDLAGADGPAREAAVAALRAGTQARQWNAVARVRGAVAQDDGPRCRATGPLTLPHEVPPDAEVDVVVLAGAHRVAAAEGALALVRARQVVVLGDPDGLPPGRVSLRGEDGAAPLEVPPRASVLELLEGALPTVRLSRQHRMPAQLCAPADAAAGKALGPLRVPAPDGAVEVLLDHVPDGWARPTADGDAESAEAEVERVVALVVQHARERPGESLAVVALSRQHARRVADALRADLPEHPDVARWLASGAPEAFVVTDADRAHDAVRDAAIVSVGVGRSPHSRVLPRFGRLDAPAGDRRLVVALTRARRRLTVVSCLRAEDLDRERLSAPGSEALASLLSFLETGRPATAPQHDTGAGDPLLEDLVRRLTARGRTPVEGTPDGPDLLVPARGGTTGQGRAEPVAVLTDLRPAPDADALLERETQVADHLARFGWRVVRLGALGLFADPDAQVRRVLGTSP